MKKFTALLTLPRPLNMLITFLVIIAAYVISAKTISVFDLIAAALSGALTAGAGNIVNDIFDIEADKINHPTRPLACNIISYNAAKWLWFFFTILSFIISSLINLFAFLIVLAVHLILIFYSFRFKSTTIAGNFIIAFLTALAFYYGGFAAGSTDKIILPAVFAFLINYIRELVKDIHDAGGDRAAGLTSFPLKYGLKNTKRVIFIFIILLLLLTFYPFVYHYYSIEFFILMMLVVNPLMIYIIKILWISRDEKTGRVSAILKFNMAVGLLAIYLGQ